MSQNRNFHRNTGGFTLVEILLSLLIMSGAIDLLFSGLSAAETLDRRGSAEMRAAVVAERELELLKTDLLGGRRPMQGSARGRFRLPGGWKSRVLWAPHENEGTIRLVARVLKTDLDIQLETFVFIPSLLPRTTKP